MREEVCLMNVSRITDARAKTIRSLNYYLQDDHDNCVKALCEALAGINQFEASMGFEFNHSEMFLITADLKHSMLEALQYLYNNDYHNYEKFITEFVGKAIQYEGSLLENVIGNYKDDEIIS